MIFPQPLSRVAERVSRHDFVLDALPPSGGLPLGNGDVSASLYGGPGFLALSVRKHDAPVGEIVLRIHSPESGGIRPATRDPRPVTLRLYDATAHVSFPDGVEVETFVAANRNLIVLRIRSGHPARLPASLELSSPGSQFRADGPFRYARRETCDLLLVMCGFVYGARSHSTVREDAVVAAFDLPPSGECLILVGVAPDAPDPAHRARTEVERALPHGYLLLQREHAVSWERFWESAETEHAGTLGKTLDCRKNYALKSQRRNPDHLP